MRFTRELLTIYGVQRVYLRISRADRSVTRVPPLSLDWIRSLNRLYKLNSNLPLG